jgi:hypothetical protein
VKGRRAVVAEERHALEGLRKPRSRLAIAFPALALAHGALVPLDPEPAQVFQDRLLPAGDIARGIRVVDSQQHRAAEVPVRDRAEGVADMERARRARSKAYFHCRGV